MQVATKLGYKFLSMDWIFHSINAGKMLKQETLNHIYTRLWMGPHRMWGNSDQETLNQDSAVFSFC
jgi:hypothetical protein